MRRLIPLLALIAAATATWLLLASDPPPQERALPQARLAAEPVRGAAAPAPELQDAPARTEVVADEPELEPEAATLALGPEALVGAIEARVVDGAGRPVAGARVALAAAAGAAGDVEDTERAADTAGVARFLVPAAGAFRLRAFAPGFLSRAVEPVVAGDAVELALAPEVQLAGLVLDDATSRPLAGALLLLESDGAVQAARSGDDGRFEFSPDSLRPALLEVLAFGRERERCAVVPGGEPLAIRMRAGGQLAGTVRDAATGSAVPYAEVTARARRKAGGARFTVLLAEARADGSGRFELDGVPEEGVEIAAAAAGYADAGVLLDEPHAGALELELARAGELAGRISLHDGAPAAGARVQLLGLDVFAASARKARAGADGTFRIERVRPGQPFRVVASHPDGSPVELELAGPPAEPLAIALPPPTRVRGRVRHPGGAPGAFALVYVEAEDPELQRAGRAPRCVRCGADGTFRVDGLGPGTWHFTAETAEAQSGEQRVEIASAQDNDLTLVLAEAAAVAGRVEDPLGQPLAAAHVRAYRRGPEGDAGALVAERLTAADGSFRCAGLAPDQAVVLRAEADGYEAAELGVAAPFPPAVVLRLAPLAALSGRVVDAATGAPVERFSVRVEGSGDGESPGWTKKQTFLSPDGSFRLEELLHSAAALRVRAAGYREAGPFAVDLAAAARGAPLLVRLEHAAEVTGRVVARGGAPLSGVRVYATAAGKAPDAPPLQATRTREDGTFRLRDLEPGDIELRAGDPSAPDLSLPPRRVDAGVIELGELVVPASGSLAIELRAVRASAVSGRVVTIAGTRTRTRLEVATGATGAAAVPALLPDSYVIECADARAAVELEDGERAAVRLTPTEAEPTEDP